MDRCSGSTGVDIIARGNVSKEITSKSYGSRCVPRTVGLEPDRLGTLLISCVSDRNCSTAKNVAPGVSGVSARSGTD